MTNEYILAVRNRERVEQHIDDYRCNLQRTPYSLQRELLEARSREGSLYRSMHIGANR